MIRKTHLSLALAGLALAVGSGAQACTTAQWGQGLSGTGLGAGALNGVVAGQPDGAGGGTSARYSGLCGLKAGAPGQMVQDGTPAAEADYIARFYVRPSTDTGTQVVFRVAEGAPDGANTMVYRVQYNRDAQQFEVVGNSSPAQLIGAAPNGKWYNVTLTWHRVGGTLDTSVQGNAATTAIVNTGLTGFASSGGATGPDFAQLGWVSGAAGSSSTIEVDAFESRRTTAIPALCRGNANAANQTRDVLDVIAIINEINAIALATGQPDTNEDGGINVLDLIAIFPIINSPTPGC